MEYKKTILLKQLFYLSVLIPLLATGCKKDVTNSIDITVFNWGLKSITTNGENEKKPNEDFSNPNAYILTFKNDSTFKLDLSTNIGGGEYKIKSNGEIIIESYSNFTEIAQSDFDDKLIEVFNEVTSYKVLGKSLTFKGSKGVVEFKKK